MVNCQPHRSVVLLMTHVLNKHVLRLYETLFEDYGDFADVLILADNSRGYFNTHDSDPRFYLFDVSDIEDLNYPGQQSLSTRNANDWSDRDHANYNFFPGNWHLPPIVFANANPDYEYYWVVEYDVWFSGNWSQLFSYFENNDADLLTTTLVRRPELADWHLWEGVEIPGKSLETRDYIRAFFPICRLSRRAVQQLDADYRQGVRGHHEGVIATLLNAAGMRLEDIGGEGEFVDPANVNRFYWNRRLRWELSPGTFVYRPVLERPGREPNMLWHPVKPAGFPRGHLRQLKRFVRQSMPGLARLYDRRIMGRVP